MAKEFFKDLPDTSTPLRASRLNGLFDGEEALGNIVVDSIRSKNLCNIQFLNLLVNSSGTVTSNDTYYNAIINTQNINSLYISGNFSLLGDNTLRIGTFDTYPTLGTTGTRYSRTSNGVLDVTNDNYVLLCFVPSSGNTIEQIKNSFQVETGSTATSYTPYQELNPDNFKNEEIVVGSIRTKNLVNVLDQTVNTSRTLYRLDTTNISGNITLSCNYNNTTSITGVIRLRETEGGTNLQEGTITANTSGTLVMTFNVTNYNTIYIIAQGYSSGYNYTISNFQVEEGSEATNYMPYQNLDNFDSGWIDMTLETSFHNYNSNDKCQYRKKNGVVYLQGAVSPTNQISANQETLFCTLPAGYRPTKEFFGICQGSGMNRWLLKIETDGKCYVARYGTSSNEAIPQNAWLPFSCLFVI